MRLAGRQRPRPYAEISGGEVSFSHLPLASHHSITSSARVSRVGGISMPSDLAVTRLMTSSNLIGCFTGRSADFAPRRGLSRPGGPVAPAHGYLLTSGSNSCATPSYQILKRGSPVLEIASAIQAFALALSAIRSARNGALSLRPPALMY